jgi:hypothetical protein
VAAGGSAEAEAQRARAASAALERKARYAAKVASDYEKGAAGERVVADVLEGLTSSGWRILHDLRAPDGGNIDHIAIGPPGVAVIDAKNWSGTITITADRRLVISRYDKTPDLHRLGEVAEHVRGLVARDGLDVAVRGYLVLTGADDRSRPSEDLGDWRILGVDRLARRLSNGRQDLAPDLVDDIADALASGLPPGGSPLVGRAGSSLPPPPPPPPPPPEGGAHEAPSSLFERAHRFYYLRSWRKAGHHRLYLSARDGTSLGWTDVNTGATTIECTGDERKFAEALLAAADPTGVKLAPGDLPKVATRLWGGRLLSRVARWHTSVLVGQEWRAFGKHRLYGTLIDPAVTTFNLGYVDLKTQEIHPAIEGNLAEDRGPAVRYLGFLLHHLPER